MLNNNIYHVHNSYSQQIQQINEPIFDCFEDKIERRKFIQKTLALFLFSILSTLVSCLYFNNNNHAKIFIQSKTGQSLSIISTITILMIIIITIFCDKLLRKSDLKYLIYLLFTFCFSWLTGLSILYVKSEIIFSSILITSGITTSLIIYSSISTIDYTHYYQYYFTGIVAIILTGIINIFFRNSLLNLLIIFSGCLMFSFMIIYDMQMIISQKHIKYKFYLDDYVLAALCLYIDTVNFFIYIVQFLIITDTD
jgi:FtsH-binding integral membrane protein